MGTSSSSALKCIDLTTGHQMWSADGFGRGGTILADGHLLVLKESGQLVLAKAVTNTYTEVARFQAVTNSCWNIPVLSEGRLYVRSTKQAASFDLTPPSPPPLRWLPPLIEAGHQLRLQIATTNGAPIDSNRLARIQVRTATNLGLGHASWTVLTNLLSLSNGVIQVPRLETRSASGTYYMVVEQP
jgi:hypothetical protein